MIDQIETGTSSVNSSEMSYLSELDQKGLKECLETCKKIQSLPFDNLILVNVASQKLHLMKDGAHDRSYDISANSQTPTGLLFVGEKIGEGQEADMVFEARQPTGQLAKADDEKSSIVGRILYLNETQEGINKETDEKDAGVDFKTKEIYIHGTNRIQEIGKAASDGSIRMRPMDVVELFDRIPTKTPLYVYNA